MRVGVEESDTASVGVKVPNNVGLSTRAFDVVVLFLAVGVGRHIQIFPKTQTFVPQSFVHLFGAQEFGEPRRVLSWDVK